MLQENQGLVIRSLTSVAVPVWLMSPVLLLILGDIVCTVTMVLLLL